MKNNDWTPDRIKKLRKCFKESQLEFARRFRISIQTLRIWEQGLGQPSGPATILLEQLEEKVEDLQPA